MDALPAVPMSMQRQAGELAEQLARAREIVEEALTALDQLASLSTCQVDEVARARWKLEVATRARLTLAQEAVAFMTMNSPTDVSSAVAEWTAAQVSLQSYLRSYKDRWTLQTFQDDWMGYRKAFAQKRDLLRAGLTRDRDCLERLLLDLAISRKAA